MQNYTLSPMQDHVRKVVLGLPKGSLFALQAGMRSGKSVLAQAIAQHYDTVFWVDHSRAAAKSETEEIKKPGIVLQPTIVDIVNSKRKSSEIIIINEALWVDHYDLSNFNLGVTVFAVSSRRTGHDWPNNFIQYKMSSNDLYKNPVNDLHHMLEYEITPRTISDFGLQDAHEYG